MPHSNLRLGGRGLCVLALFAVLFLWAAPGAADVTVPPTPQNAPDKLSASCALLDDPKIRGRMDGLLHKLLVECGREHELGRVRQEVAVETVGEGVGTDVAVSDPTGEDGVASHTQSETALVESGSTGTICAGYNDSYHNNFGNGFTGFSRSTDGGATFTDMGALGDDSRGDPSIVWSARDDMFYFAALHTAGLGVYSSDDDCQTFVFVDNSHVGGGDDKELMAVDNNAGSAFYGRLYMAWTDFNAGGAIFVNFSDDGGANWSTPLQVSANGAQVQGAWPVVAPNSDVYVGWVEWVPSFPDGDVTIDIVRSTDGGASFSLVTPPVTGQDNPRDATATGNCGRPALNGNIRYLPSPQLAVGPDGVLHATYSYDPDGFGTGDVIDVFYRRSTDNGATWGPEVRINDDATTNDQYQPSLSVGATNVVNVSYYDRQLDPNNLLLDYYSRTSFDGGVTWEPSKRVSDVSTPVYLDPNLAGCYHSDYDQQIQTQTAIVYHWSDDRNIQSGHNDPDTFSDSEAVSTDFLVLATPREVSVCAPDDAVYDLDVPQFQGFAEPVTLSSTGEPAGSTVGFGTNPVTPPGTSVMTVSNTGAASAGTSTITVTGTSAPSAFVHDVDVVLNIFDAVPGASTLTAPADGAMNQILQPEFTWTAATQGATYTIEIATDGAFTNIVASASGIAGTSFTPDMPLDSNLEHFWRVRADNTCGTGADSTVFNFFTEPLPGDCPLGVPAMVSFEEDFEGGAGAWTTGGTGSTWVISTARANSGVNSFHAEDVPVVSDQYLISPPMDVPSDLEAPLTLQFWNHQTMEDRGAAGCWDGGVVEVSTDGGSTWTRLEAELLTDPYDGPAGGANPLAPDAVWCGDPQDWLESIVDIDAFAGQTVQFRFRLGTDGSVGREGWYIDDVRIQSCLNFESLFRDGFETGDTTVWSGTGN